jgi:hypothetical protein
VHNITLLDSVHQVGDNSNVIKGLQLFLAESPFIMLRMIVTKVVGGLRALHPTVGTGLYSPCNAVT